MPAIISRKELEHNGIHDSIPVPFVELGRSGLVHVWGKNTGTSNVKLGVVWVVTDPDGLQVEWYSDEEFGTTGPNSEHHFIGGRFDLFKHGEYRIVIAIYIVTNGWNPVDEYSGNLCTVAIAEVFAGTISRKELEYDESRAPIPAPDIPQGKRGLVHIWGRNDMATNQKMGISWVVLDPDGIEVEAYSAFETYWTGPGNAHEFIGGRFDLNKVGNYLIYVGLFMNPDAPVMVDDYATGIWGTLCTVVPAVPEPDFQGFGVTEYITV